MNQKAARREAEHYLWHLRPEWRKRFDHEHWWNGKENEVPTEAVVWEIVRRHPNAEHIHQRWNSNDEMNTLQISIGADGFSSWPKLTPKQKNDFQKRIWKHLPSQRGYVVPPVTVLNDLRPLEKYVRTLKSKGDEERLAKLEARLARRLCDEILSFYRRGQIIIAVNPSEHPLPIADLVKAAVEDWQGSVKPAVGGRARNDQRLNVIANFEREELSRDRSKTNRNADMFTRYRRIIGSFAPPLLTETPDH